MKQITAVFVGFSAAAAVPAALAALFTPLGGSLDIISALGTFLVALPFSILAILFFGVPAFLMLRHFRLIRWWTTVLAGFCLGVLVAIVTRLPAQPRFHDFVVFAPMAALSAFTFWLIWRLRDATDADVGG